MRRITRRLLAFRDFERFRKLLYSAPSTKTSNSSPVSSAQPQHVRNDQHMHGIRLPFFAKPFDPEWSFFERYTKLDVDDQIGHILDAHPYPTPIFDTARQFWYTPGATTARFRGMAEFTAQNYVSFGTQYAPNTVDAAKRELLAGNADYPLPNGANRSGSAKNVATENLTIKLTTGVTVTGPVDFVIGSVYDKMRDAGLEDQRLASPSMVNVYFDESILHRQLIYIENSAVYEHMYAILLPRAVAFSAGLVNHFFRGRIDLRREADGTRFPCRIQRRRPSR